MNVIPMMTVNIMKSLVIHQNVKDKKKECQELEKKKGTCQLKKENSNKTAVPGEENPYGVPVKAKKRPEEGEYMNIESSKGGSRKKKKNRKSKRGKKRKSGKGSRKRRK